MSGFPIQIKIIAILRGLLGVHWDYLYFCTRKYGDAPVVQWIEYRIPVPTIWVRFSSGVRRRECVFEAHSLFVFFHHKVHGVPRRILLSYELWVPFHHKRDVRLSGILGMSDGCVVHPDDFVQQKTHGHKGRVFGIDHDVLLYFKAPFAHFHPVGRWNEWGCPGDGATPYDA